MEAEVYDVDATHPMAAAIDRAVGVLKEIGRASGREGV